jgi:hypothetical protein
MPISLVALFLVGHLLYGQEVLNMKRTQDDNAISSETAIEKAFLYTGFDKVGDFLITKGNLVAEQKTVYDSTAVFLRDSIDGRQAWSVKFLNVKINTTKSSNEAEVTHPTTYEVIMDCQSGKLLKIVSSLLGEEDQKIVEDKPLMSKIEVPGSFMSFANSLPKHTFFDVLWADGRNEPFDFAHVSAVYGMYILDDSIPRPFWGLTFEKEPGTGIFTTADPIYGRECRHQPVASVVIIDDEINQTRAVAIKAANIKDDRLTK